MTQKQLDSKIRKIVRELNSVLEFKFDKKLRYSTVSYDDKGVSSKLFALHQIYLDSSVAIYVASFDTRVDILNFLISLRYILID